MAGYELKTLNGLAAELKNLAKRPDLAWLSDQVIVSEVDAATVALTKAQRQAIGQDALEIQKVGNAVLYEDYRDRKLKGLRALSLADSKALAACLELNAALSTDEWPLRLVSEMYDYDNGNSVRLFSSVELIALLEQEGLIARDTRIRTYADWLKNGEKLLRESQAIYFRLFNEAPPTAQN